MSATESEERAQFTLAMRAGGINDLALLRALERAPRALFMPPRFADISGRDIALPIGCGQTSPPPSIAAAMIAALNLKPSHRVCEIGTGTGYCTALLAQLANTIVSLERFQNSGGGGVGENQGLRTPQCHSALGGRVRAAPLGGTIRSGPDSRPHRAARRGVSQPHRRGWDSGCGRRRPGPGRAAHRQTDRQYERRGRGCGPGSGAGNEAARARVGAGVVAPTRALDARIST